MLYEYNAPGATIRNSRNRPELAVYGEDSTGKFVRVRVSVLRLTGSASCSDHVS